MTNLNFSKYYESFLQISYTLRRLNVLAYEKSQGYSTEVTVYKDPGQDDQAIKFSVYQKALKQDLKLATSLERSEFYDWGDMVNVIDFSEGQIKSKELTS